MKPKKYTAGFTLIEIVITITIIGILAVTLTPRLVDMTTSSHEYAVSQTGLAFGSAVLQAHNQWRLQGNGTAEIIQGYTDLAGNPLYSNANGFPLQTNISTDPDRCVSVWQALLPKRGAPTASMTPGADYLTTFSSPSFCVYTYQHGGNMSITYNRDAGVVAVDSIY